MIALPSIAFGGFSGSAKGVTARQVDGRSILSVKCYPTGDATRAQLARRASLKKISKSWRDLTTNQMREWDRLAEHASGISTFGQKAELSGMNMYVRLNANRVMVGRPLLSEAPVYTADVPEVDYDDFWVTPDVIAFAGLNCPDSEHRLVVKMSGGQSTGVSSGWSKTVIVAPGVEDDGCETNITSLYLSTIGFAPKLGEKIFIELWWLDAETGFVGETMRVTAICKNESQIEGEIYVPRTIINMDNIEYDPTKTRFDKLSVEEVPGSALFIADMEFELLSYLAGVNAAMTTIPENFISAISFIPARGKGRYQWAVSLLEINVYIGSSYNTVNFSKRDGGAMKHMEVFGVGLIK